MNLGKILKLTIKIGFSIALIWWIVQAVDGEALIQHLKHISGLTVLGLIVCMTILSVIQAMRWRILLRGLGTTITPRHAISITFLSTFFNQTLPSTLGGDVLRVWSARRSGTSLGVATNSVIVDRVMALLALLLLGALGIPHLLSLDTGGVTALAVIGLIAASAGGAVVLSILHMLPSSWTRWPVFRGLMDLSRTFVMILQRSKTVFHVVGLSLAIHLGVVAVTFLIGRSLDPSANFGDYLVVIPAVILVSSLPITIAGWGVREGAMVVGLGLAGIPADLALAVSLLFGGLLILVGLLGAALWIIERRLPGAATTHVLPEASDWAAATNPALPQTINE